MTKKFNEIVKKVLLETNGEVDTELAWPNIKYNNDLLIKEGLIMSYNVDALYNSLKKIRGIKEVSPIGSPSLKIYYPIRVRFTEELDINKFKSVLNVHGYFISSQGKGYSVVEAKYPMVLDPEDRPNEFYHVAPQGIITKIMERGLIVKSSKRKEFRYNQNRIYLFWSNNIKFHTAELSKKLFISSLNNFKSPNSAENFKKYKAKSPNDYVLIRINSSELMNHQLFIDPQFEVRSGILSVFTLRNIHPNSLEIVS